jgi:hypothetical protein
MILISSVDRVIFRGLDCHFASSSIFFASKTLLVTTSVNFVSWVLISAP